VKAAEKNFHAKVPQELKKALKNSTAKNADRICLDFTVDLIGGLKKAGAPGVHMFTLNDVNMLADILENI
jgi:5,10-methylenetetrahydrofolate reductase